jgi:predicted ATPase
VTLVTSSNAAPTDLYKDGLQRARFLPAIALLQQHCVVELVSRHRLPAARADPFAGVPAPLDAGSDAWLGERWRELGGDDGTWMPASRSTAAASRCARAARACAGSISPRCAKARAATPTTSRSRASSTPCCSAASRAWTRNRDDAARRFVILVDELYDRHVNLVCTAEAAPMALYAGERLVAAFERTASRLIEMQSTDGAGDIANEVRTFDAGQKVYISVPAKFGRKIGDKLEIFWFHDDNRSRHEEQKQIAGPFTVFEFAPTDVGAYNVEIAANGRPIALVQFEVK